jgi:hypothetical protein
MDVEPIRSPICSLQNENPDLDEAIHEFVIRLAEQVDLLQDDEFCGDLEALEERCSLLGSYAATLGYPDFSDLARKLSQACDAREKDGVQQSLVALTEMTRCIRLGHRGAA